MSAPGSASPKVLAAFSALAQPVKLPAGLDIRAQLRGSTVVSYDPTHAALLSDTNGTDTYLIAAKLTSFPKARACAKVPGGPAFSALRRSLYGSGPGVLVIQRDRAGDVTVTEGSLSAVDSYLGGPELPGRGSGAVELVVPDGVTSIQYVLRDGKLSSAAVSHNLVNGPTPAGDSPPALPLSGVTAAYKKRLTRWFGQHLPTAVRWIGPGGTLLATHRLPPGLISATVRSLQLEISLLQSAAGSVTVGTGSSSGTTSSGLNFFGPGTNPGDSCAPGSVGCSHGKFNGKFF